MLRALAGVLATAAALNPSATTRRQLGAGLAGAGLTIVAPPAFAEVLDIPPATTKMGGLLEKYADVARGAETSDEAPHAVDAAPARRRGVTGELARPRRRREHGRAVAETGLHSPLAPRAGQPRLSAAKTDDLEPI